MSNLSFWIARRYLFAKKSTNAINIITGISVVGIALGTATLILVLSIFNGFENLILGLFSHFNPDIKVALVKGKTFEPDSTKIYQIGKLSGVQKISKTLEEIAFFEYAGSQDFGTIKGTDEAFRQVINIDTTIKRGEFRLGDGDRSFAVVGAGMQNKLSISIENDFEPITIYMPKQQEVGVLDQQFRKRFLYPSGMFSIQQEFDNQYIITNLAFVQSLIETQNISALEIKLKPTADKNVTISEIQEVMGSSFSVKDRYRQDEAFLKVMNIEKWLGFAVTVLMLFLVTFNLVGALWMIMLDKKKDLSILKTMGMTDASIRNIFLQEGLLISALGIIVGLILAIILYFLQKKYGILSLSTGFVVDSYPISMRFVDVVAVIFTVLIIGFLAAILPAQKAAKITTVIGGET